jgi:hypothetical protein
MRQIFMGLIAILFLFWSVPESKAKSLKSKPDHFIDSVESIQQSKDFYYISFKLQARLFMIDKKDKQAPVKLKILEQGLNDKKPLGILIDPIDQKILEIYGP